MKVFDRTKGTSWGKLGICARLAAVALVAMAFTMVGCKQHAGGGEPPAPAPTPKIIPEIKPEEVFEFTSQEGVGAAIECYFYNGVSESIKNGAYKVYINNVCDYYEDAMNTDGDPTAKYSYAVVGETIKGNDLFGTEDRYVLKLEILDASTKAKVDLFYVVIDETLVAWGGPKGYLLFETTDQIVVWEQQAP